ncbi:hypothetical protein F5X99DRAFT_416029 [Biscogniauxia marginata]|nr:hypothetical protein F5X99DRAFT_416029 [Biscogniauxia marginata]
MQTILHYAYPLVVFLYFAISSGVASCLPDVFCYTTKATHVRKKTIWWLLLLVVASFGIQLILKAVEVISTRRWPSQDTIVGLLSCILIFGVEQNSLSTVSEIVWPPFYGSWLLSLLLEPANAAILLLRARAMTRATPHELYDESPFFLRLDASVTLLRFVVILSVILVYFIGRHGDAREGTDEECAPLIPKPDRRPTDSADSGYGTNSDTTHTETTNTQTANSSTGPESSCDHEHGNALKKTKKRWNSEGTLAHQVSRYMILLPYVWPSDDRWLQLRVALVGLCVLSGNGLNFLIPRQYGTMVDSLTGASDWNIWVQVIIYSVLQLLDSPVGIPLLQQLLWSRVEFASDDAITAATFTHVINLSSEFHDSQSSSDLLTTIEQTTSPLNLIKSIFLGTVPTMIDMVVAFTYLSAIFGPYEGFITITTGLAYVQISAIALSKMGERSKKAIQMTYDVNRSRQAGVQGWYTVFAYSRQQYEDNRYRTALRVRTEVRKESQSKNFWGNIFQDLVVLAGLLAGIFLAVYQIRHGHATSGDFVMLLTYWHQLTAPFYSLFMMGSGITGSFIAVERLIDLMLTKPTVVDKENARPLEIKAGGGTVEFRNVRFSYDKNKEILKGLNLIIPAGCTVAFVGETGVGKSTVLRLLNRQYDVTSGSILIDGQDIRDVTQSSLRNCTGIVPQNPFVFDDTIAKNVEYGRLGASMDEIKDACEKAAIHDKIMSFTDKYETRVGERGVKISGGELQRIAIARSILKQPNIVLLDEATSAVDTITERKIQAGLDTLTKGKTTIAVAHRLSTIMNADIIFVMSDGEIFEQGKHEDLISKGGRYAELWDSNFFVEPNSSKKDTEDDELAQPLLTQNTQGDGPADEPISEASTSTATHSQTTPDKNKSEENQTVNEQVAKTPDRHKKEVDLAPEFTPRSMAVLESMPASPIRNTGDGYVAGADSPQATPVVDIESASLTTALKACEGSQCKPESSPVPTKAREKSFESTIMASGPRPRRNTMQSVSCPEPHSFHNSPVRSVSQPPRPTSPEKTPTPVKPFIPLNDRQPEPEPQPETESQPNPELESSSKPSENKPEPTTAEIQPPPRGASRGRGAFRGRRGRGRHRRGRGRHSLSNPNRNQNQGTNTSSSRGKGAKETKRG